MEINNDETDSDELRVEIPANRYDLLCVEGLCLSLKNYLNKTDNKDSFILPSSFKLVEPKHTLNVDPIVKKVRPFVVAGILRNVSFCELSYNSFIDFQDKLHHNLGRKRTLVSIGTHDLDKIKGPFTYTAKKKEDVNFIPLNQDKSFRADELLKFYENDMHLKNYLHIIKDSEYVPLVTDSTGNILSMPPIINSEYSKIDLNTKNVFIDITATDKTKALMALNVIMSAFSSYSKDKFKIEQVNIKETDASYLTPVGPLATQMQTNLQYLQKMIGMKIELNQVKQGLLKMGLNYIELAEHSITVEYPFYRTDIMHPCDIAEDIAIAIGYDNIPYRDPDVICLGEQNNLNKMTELMRAELACCGYTEVLNFSLCSKDELGKKMLLAEDKNAIVIANPKTQDFQVGRTTLIPGMLKCLFSNKHNNLPFKFFEIGDIMLLCSKDKNIYTFEEKVGAKEIGVEE